jgi:hypothetical protein
VYAIDLGGKTTQQLVTGTELQHPYLWGKKRHATTFSLDSLGMYNYPPEGNVQAEIATNLLIYWRIFDTLTTAIIGSSQSKLGIIPQLFTHQIAYNLAVHGGPLSCQKGMVMNYLLPHSANLKMVCSSLDIGWLWIPDEDGWGASIGKSTGFIYDSAHGFWPNSTADNIRSALTNMALPFPSSAISAGFISSPSQGWGTDIPPYPDPQLLTLTIDYSGFQQNLNIIRKLADTLGARGVHWILVNFPVSPNYKNTPSYSLHGPSWPTANEIVARLIETDSTNPYFHFYDANRGGDNDFVFGDFYDENHLSGQGAAKLSRRVDSLIHTIVP